MELKPGYKQTEVGVIPQDWDLIDLGEISTISRLAGAEYTSLWEESDDGEIIALRGFNIGKNSINHDEIVRISSELSKKLKRSKLCKGDVVYPCVGTIGNAAVIYEDNKYHIQQNIARITPNKNAILSEFLVHYLTSSLAEREVARFNATSSQPNVLVSSLRQYRVLLPRNYKEQEAIAKALSDMDALIQSLEQQIIKKQQIKQGAMQTLLNPYDMQNILKPGWEQKSFDKVFSIGHGRDQKGIISTDGCFPILATSGEIGRTNHYLYDKPSVLIGRKGTIDEPQYMDTPFWTIDTLFYTEVFKPNNAKFLFYLFCLIDWYAYNEASGVPSLSAKTILNIKAAMPPADEQNRIADSLTEMDNEIAELEAKLTKNKQLKQGMMQNLLTGTVRLV